MSSDEVLLLEAREYVDEHDIDDDVIPLQQAPRKNFFQRHQTMILLVCGLAALAATFAVMGAAGAFGSPSHHNKASTAGFQTVPHSEAFAHPLFSSYALSSSSIGSEAGLVRHKASLSFKDAKDRLTSLEYDVEHKEEIMQLELASETLGINCTATGNILILAKSADDAVSLSQTISVGSVIPLMGFWGCGEHIREVTASPVVHDQIITVPTKIISLTDVFKHAMIRIHHEYNNETATNEAVKAHQNSVPMSSGDRRERRGVLSFFHKAWDAVTTVAKTVFTGSLDVKPQQTTMWQYNSGPQACVSELGVDVASCSCGLNLASIVEIDIHDWQLQSMILAVKGTANAEMHTDVISKTFSGSSSDVLFDRKLWSGVIPVGTFPIPIAVFGKLTLDYDWSITPSLNLNSKASTTGSIELGIQYSNGEWGLIKQHSFQKNFQYNGVQASVDADLKVGVTPQLFLKAAYVGGPFAQITFNVDGEADAQYGQGGCDATVDVSASVDVGVGAYVDIDILGHELYKHQWYTQAYTGPVDQLAHVCLA